MVKTKKKKTASRSKARRPPSRSRRSPSGSCRAGLLADRIEKGAAELAAFAAGLSDGEWRTAMSATDRRTVGVVVSHVAFVYPIEVELAQTIAKGKAVPTSWKDVAQLNANHAGDNGEVTKASALEALAKNSREAAAAVRKLTDKELDTAAPFGLSYGAPVTAQFVIEDHALRHSWHHLAKIKEAIGRS
jgi:DinB superfamily